MRPSPIQTLTGLDVRTAQVVPGFEVIDLDVVLAGDPPKGVATLHHVLDRAAAGGLRCGGAVEYGEAHQVYE